MISNVAVIIRYPQGDERSVIGIRTAYALQAGGYDTTLTMMGDGIYNLTGRRPSYLDNLMNQFLDSSGKLYCLARDLDQRGVEKDACCFPVEIIDSEELAEIMGESDSINVF